MIYCYVQELYLYSICDLLWLLVSMVSKWWLFLLQDVTHHMDMAYGMLGSVFRSGKFGAWNCVKCY